MVVVVVEVGIVVVVVVVVVIVVVVVLVVLVVKGASHSLKQGVRVHRALAQNRFEFSHPSTML